MFTTFSKWELAKGTRSEEVERRITREFSCGGLPGNLLSAFLVSQNTTFGVSDLKTDQDWIDYLWKIHLNKVHVKIV